MNRMNSIEAASAQIHIALREAEGPVETLCRTLERMAGHVQALREQVRAHAAHCADEQGQRRMDTTMEALLAELSLAVQSMQFYDRLFQHLSHVNEYLSGGADTLSLPALSSAPRSHAAASGDIELF